jgi:hypothetical protein
VLSYIINPIAFILLQFHEEINHYKIVGCQYSFSLYSGTGTNYKNSKFEWKRWCQGVCSSQNLKKNDLAFEHFDFERTEGYLRNVSCALNLMFTFFYRTFVL